MIAQVTLTPTESKKLIAKAVANMKELKNAAKNGLVVLHPSSSTFFIVEEITGTKPNTNAWTCGVVTPRGTCHELGVWLTNLAIQKTFTIDPGAFPHSWVIRNGKMSTGEELTKLLEEMKPSDFYIKGVNALDPFGDVGVLVGSPVENGSIGRVLTAHRKKGFKLVWPVGLEKLIPISIKEAANKAKSAHLDYAMGMPVHLLPCPHGQKIDEMDAISYLSGASAVPISAGGLGGAEGATTLVVKGEAETVNRAIQYIEQSKGAQLPQIRLSNCSGCTANKILCKYNLESKHWVQI